MIQSEQRDKDTPAAHHHEAARNAAIFAILLGIAADQLLWNGPMGAAWPLWIALFGATAVLLVRRAGFAWQTEAVIAAALAVAAATISAVRASELLNLLALLVLVAAASLPFLRARSFRFAATSLPVQLLGLASIPVHAAGGAVPLLASDLGRAQLPARTLRVPLLALRGVLLAVPPLVVFGALFVAADPLFEHYTNSLAQMIRQDVLRHVMFALVFTWISAGLLRTLLPKRSPLHTLPELPAVPSTEVAIALSAVTALFLAFVIVQARWFFGGAAALEAATGLTVAEYARRGFFQMVVAAALVLPMLLVADAATRHSTTGARYLLRTLSGALIALVFLVMFSALQRMALYTQRFGLTEQRLYTTAFMGWLVVVFAWYAITTLRGRRRRFAAGPFAAGIATVFTLAALNPDALIARVNFERAGAGASVDAVYLRQLSADAVPELIAHFQQLPAEERCTLAKHLLKRHGKYEYDWRSANHSLLTAADMVDTHRAELAAATGCPTK